MFGIHDLALFIIYDFLLILTPDFILIMSRSDANGWPAWSVAAFGVCTGCYVHMVAAALGLFAILTSSATAFSIVKLIGAAYLVYKGLSALSTNIAYNPLSHADHYRESVFYRFFQLSESAYCLYKESLLVGHKIEYVRSSGHDNGARVEFGFSHNPLIVSNMSAS